VSVLAEAARVVPMTGLPVPEMAAELVPVPMVIAMHGEVMPIVMVIVLPMHIVMAEMIESMAVKSMAVKSMAEKAVAEAVRAAAFGCSVDLRQRESEQTSRSSGDQFS